jgi:hypothetical protein
MCRRVANEIYAEDSAIGFLAKIILVTAGFGRYLGTITLRRRRFASGYSEA